MTKKKLKVSYYLYTRLDCHLFLFCDAFDQIALIFSSFFSYIHLFLKLLNYFLYSRPKASQLKMAFKHVFKTNILQ